jgi:hypothetical protein
MPDVNERENRPADGSVGDPGCEAAVPCISTNRRRSSEQEKYSSLRRGGSADKVLCMDSEPPRQEQTPMYRAISFANFAVTREELKIPKYAWACVCCETNTSSRARSKTGSDDR